jgi:hypothetical protein
MPEQKAVQATVLQNGGAQILARMLGGAGTLITQATIDTITCAVVDLGDTSTILSTPDVVVADTVFDTIQGADSTDARWTKDETGYNFLHELPAGSFVIGNRSYAAHYKFTPASGEVFWLVTGALRALPTFEPEAE